VLNGLRERRGIADLRTGAAVPFDGYFRAASNTKTFIAVVVLQLVGEGRLTLEDTVERWLPGVVFGNGNDGRQITVTNLLQHTSGIFNRASAIPSLQSPEGYLAHRLDQFDAADLVAIAMQHPPDFAHGTHWGCSTTNYVLLGLFFGHPVGVRAGWGMAEIKLPKSWDGVAEPLRELMAEVERRRSRTARRHLTSRLCRRGGAGERRDPSGNACEDRRRAGHAATSTQRQIDV
jgi:hypothetical protein